MKKYQDEKITLSGIHLDKTILNDFFLETGKEGVTRDQFLTSLNIKKEVGAKVNQADVIVDMSAGMNLGIDKSFAAITSVMQRFNPGQSKYYHVDDDPTMLQPITEIKSLSDANFLQNPANYKKLYSKLRPAFESASKANNKITIIVTDFLLDEGIKGARRLKNGKFTNDESADNSTWASEYFTKWISGNNRVLIYPFKYTALNYYKKNETKNIYYIIFEPKGCINSQLDNLKKDFSGIFSNVIDINPSEIHLVINDKNIPGECVSNYNLIKDNGNKHQVFADYFTEYIPFSFVGIRKNSHIDKPVVCNMVVDNKTPFYAHVATESYDLSKVYYKTLATSKEEWNKKNLYEEAKQVNDLVCDINNDSSLTYKFGASVGKENFMSSYATYAKLLYSRIIVKDMTIKPLDNSLSWDFESKYGTMENNALKESLRLALDDYKAAKTNFQIGSLLVSIHDK